MYFILEHVSFHTTQLLQTTSYVFSAFLAFSEARELLSAAKAASVPAVEDEFAAADLGVDVVVAFWARGIPLNAVLESPSMRITAFGLPFSMAEVLYEFDES